MVNQRGIEARTATRGLLRALLGFGLWLLAAAAFAQQAAPIPAMDSPVVDTTGTLDATARANLEAQARALQQRKGSQLQILMVPSTLPEEIEPYAVRAFEQFKLGRKGVDDGVLVVVAKDDRRVRIEVGYGLEGAITDLQSGRIIQEYIAPKFRAGDYAGGLTDATAMLVRLIDGEPLPEPMGRGAQSVGGADDGNWVLALFLAVIGSSLIRGVLSAAPAILRGLIGAAGVGAVAWLLGMAWWLIGLSAVAGFLLSLLGRGGGHYVGGGGWGGYGGGWGGGGGGGGGGWSGGGGSSGGGGASGSW
ncbi:TPM domain-containing protein [Lysobacter sp. K5869]|uniref:TPM domain-containing protein n=1 Tax=Lysobacter sp. K5869 TaxID=2820808 RepID=UPI001C061C48|nr:TPM domain-containing protein [Lysobacter sp. K5869]QWP78785.1 TPM domain-containing protein [Lysobacter sp. K5869]